VKVLITGGAGFIGGAITRQLRARGDEVVALVRDRNRTSGIEKLGAEVIEDDLSDVARLTAAIDGADAAIHAAGTYRIGITKAERGAMWDANVGTTTRVLDAAEAAGTPRIVYVSTVNTFGNTRGVIVDETYRRDLGQGFLSWYDETKYGAHEVADQRIAAGAPVLVAMPGTVIGPADHSQAGAQLRQAHDGTLPYIGAARMGMSPVHVEDEGAGIIAVLDRGAVGRSYVLAGDCIRLIDALTIAASLGGKRLPRFRIPDGVLRAMAPFGRLIGEPNAREIARASAGVTYWASSQRAKDELGYAPRDAETAIRDTFATA
jgi:dihydroflavonol-4-reductase